MLNVARELRSRAIPCVFVCNPDSAAEKVLQGSGMPVTTADVTDATSPWERGIVEKFGVSVWINDRLDTDTRHAGRLRSLGVRTITFDDDGGGAALHDLHVAALATIQGKRPRGKRVLSGLEYLVLDPAIGQLRRKRSEGRRWVVCLGGADTYGVTVRVVELLRDTSASVTVLLGPAFRHDADLSRVIPTRFGVKRAVPSVPTELAAHDVAVTGGGITAFEACCSGLPTIVVANEHHEVPLGLHLERLGCARFAGHYSSVTAEPFANPLPIPEMSQAGLERVPANGLGAVCEELQALM
jgi:spore coat polysaccharide biosynthesis predicted glycosyltransferase SpsG